MKILFLLTALLISSCGTLTQVVKRDTDRAKGIVGLHVAFVTNKKVNFGQRGPDFSDKADNWQIEEAVENAVKESLDSTGKALRRFAITTDPNDVRGYYQGLQLGDALLVLYEEGIRMGDGDYLVGAGFLLHNPLVGPVQTEPFIMLTANLVYPGKDVAEAIAYNTKWVDGYCGPFVYGIPAHKSLAEFTPEEKERLRGALHFRIGNTVNALLSDLGLAKRFRYKEKLF